MNGVYVRLFGPGIAMWSSGLASSVTLAWVKTCGYHWNVKCLHGNVIGLYMYTSCTAYKCIERVRADVGTFRFLSSSDKFACQTSVYMCGYLGNTSIECVFIFC